MKNSKIKGVNMRAVIIVLLATLSVGCASLSGSRSEKPMDQDNDSIADAQDVCGQTASGSVVNESGCALFTGPIENLEFGPDDHGLNSGSRAALDNLITELARNPEVFISLGGHTDNRGSAAANLQLSKKRVMAVVRYLVSNGVDPRRLKPYGFGESRPIVSNATEEGRIKNRRIEVNVIAQEVIAQ